MKKNNEIIETLRPFYKRQVYYAVSERAKKDPTTEIRLMPESCSFFDWQSIGYLFMNNEVHEIGSPLAKKALGMLFNMEELHGYPHTSNRDMAVNPAGQFLANLKGGLRLFSNYKWKESSINPDYFPYLYFEKRPFGISNCTRHRIYNSI